MKTTEKTFDAVAFMRQRRKELGEKLAGKSKEEILQYFKERTQQATTKPAGQ